MDLFQLFRRLNIDGGLISLEYSEITAPYFCYPVNAEVIGFEGCILYCFLPEYGDMVFASNPESCADKNVYPLAASFEDFLRLILACGTANPVEQIVWMDQRQFERHLQEEMKTQTERQKELLALLKHELNLTPMEHPFEYVKALQANFDGSKIQYSEEYYDTLGLESPHGNNRYEKEHSSELNPIRFEIRGES